MGKAWNDAVALLTGNLGLIATIVGLFYFLPPFAAALLFPELTTPQAIDAPPGTDPMLVYQQMMTQMQEQLIRSWPLMLALFLLQYFGTLTALALFPDRGNPTVGEALANGLKGMPTYVASLVIFSFGIGIGLGLLLSVAILIHAALGLLVALVVLVTVIYLAIKFTLVPTVIAMEGERNPITAILRSWRLTKGNSLRIFAFLLVLVVVMWLVGFVAILALGTGFALAGGSAATIGMSFLEALFGAVMGAIMIVVLAAIHRQLSGTSARETATETFD